jgi:three-Cys-motif partner protein
MGEGFFQISKEQSVIKAEIVSKYFDAWARVIRPSVQKHGAGKIGYIDFFAGPGRYEDGTESTPLAVLKKAIADPDLAGSLVATFNDKDSNNTRSLIRHLDQLDGIGNLKHPPQVFCSEVDATTAAIFKQIKTIPSLFFVDPWGYKGLSLDLVNAVIKDWACECIFFFNYNRINMGLNNSVVRDHMNALFSEEVVQSLVPQLEQLNSVDRETAIVEALCQTLKAGEHRPFVLPFRFRDANGTRTSHHLIFVTKHFRGYEIMKEIMAKASSDNEEGIASFEYSPARQQDMFLFGFTRPKERLAGELLEKYAGRSMTVGELYRDHNVGTPFILANYKDVLKGLVEQKLVTAQRREGKNIRKNTMPEDVVITYPARKT